MRKIYVGLVVVGLLLAIYAGASWYFSSILVGEPHPVTAENRAYTAEFLAEQGIPMPEDVQIAAGDGITIAGALYDQPDNRCGVVVLHGHTSNRYRMAGLTPLFWDMGCDVLAFDARGHGDSTDAWHTFGFYEREDASAVVDWFAERMGLPPAQIGLWGVSYGGATSLQLLNERDDLGFVIADAAYEDYETIVSHQAVEQFGPAVNLVADGAIRLAELRADFDGDVVSPKAAVAHNAITPVLIVHSVEDEFTPVSHAEAIYESRTGDNVELVLTEWGAGHGASYFTDQEAYSALVYEFINENAPQMMR